MLRATVVGNVWATKRLPEVPAGAFLEVEAEGGAHLVAFDVLGTGVGERVLIATGSVAAAWFPGRPPPIDALIIGSIDEPPTPPAPRSTAPVTPAPATTAPATTPPATTAAARRPRSRKE